MDTPALDPAAADPSAPAADASAPSAPAPPAARIVSDRPRVRTVALDYPVEHAGTLWTAIPIRRLTAREVADYIQTVRANPQAAPDLPMVDAPQAVLDALDDDDAYAVEEATKAFLPHRFRAPPASD